MRKILNSLISKVKKENFELDKGIPLSYLALFIIRRMIFLLSSIIRFRRFAFICPNATIRCKSKFKFGSNTSIDKSCYLDALSVHGIILGDNVSIGKFTTIECTGTLKEIGLGLLVGNNVGLGTHGFFGCAGGIEIGNDVIFGNYVSMHSENHNYSQKCIPIRLQGVNRKGIKIGNNCWIGAKVTILDGSEIGNNCVIAAGAVVRGKFPDNSVIGGVPAKIIKTIL